ncbi:hypothetical protein V5E97_37925 [Singulisphaera sp. Ch08]|uniref:Uncharacterized protein n=1 Tax=Singulisphaera sp. Ch08 TaxID=3120278 RepID=A0AAU7CG19_9BACT
MRRPRLNIQTWMIVVAIMAVGFAIIVYVSRWSDRSKTILYERISGYTFLTILGGLGKLFENWWVDRRARRRVSPHVHPMWDSWNDGLPR